MSDFLSALGDQINSQFLGGELGNSERNLSGTLNGQRNNYAKLGDFAKKIDQSAQRNYVEEGYLQSLYKKASAKLIEISMQEPEATVLVKKKMYSSLANNFYPGKSSQEERMTLMVMDRLFYNKCKQISAYEKLCKIQNAVKKTGELDEQLLPIIIGFGDLIGTFNNKFGSGSFFNAIKGVKAAFNYSLSSNYTQWIEDIVTPYALRNGYGTGVIEITNFTSIQTNCNVNGENASFNISLEDPYELMSITPMDIEYAINDVISTSAFNSGKYTLFNAGNSLNSSLQISGELLSKKIKQLTDLRNSRGASAISFKLNPNTIYGRKVIAIVDATGQEIPFKADPLKIKDAEVARPYLLGGEVLGEQGLSTKETKMSFKGTTVKGAFSNTELSLFSDVVNAIYTQIGLESNTTKSFTNAGGDEKNVNLVNMIRRKLTFYFAGKQIIQPMDTVNIYMSSRTKFDSKIMSGIQNAFSGFGLFKGLNDAVNNLFSNGFGAFISNDFESAIEKSVYLGNSDFPNYFWNALRNQFTASKEGTHVYAGIVNSVNSSYSGGNFSVYISGADNTSYLKMGPINYNPGVNNNVESVIYDPLTPYQTNFDSIYPLGTDLPYLQENQQMIDTGLLLSPAGPNAGGSVTDVGKYFDSAGLKNGSRVQYSPDGLVYKWKEGIGIYNQRGSSTEIFQEKYTGQQKSASDVLAGQDVMNIVSLLVTGQPYDYAKYYKAGKESGALNTAQYNANNESHATLTVSAISQLAEKINRNNSVWGGFVPFKKIMVSEQNFLDTVNVKVQSVYKQQAFLQSIYKDIESLQSASTLAAVGYANSLTNGEQKPISIGQAYAEEIKQLQKYVENIQQEYIKNLSSTGITVIGDDVSVDNDQFINNDNFQNPEDKDNARRKLRKKMNLLTRRLPWKVRANKDPNLFIVDDTYDKSYDLFAFETNITGVNGGIYNSEYTYALDKIKAATQVLDLEFFADTQGHLRVRSPQYNRIPSSIFLKMLANKTSGKKIQIFPAFLNEIFFNQIKSLYNQITTCEDYIRLYASIANVGNTLGIDGDDNLSVFLDKSSTNLQFNTNIFVFLSDPQTGEVSDYGKLYSFSPDVNPDSRQKDNDFSKIKELNKELQAQLNIQTTFDIGGRLKTLTGNFNSSAVNTDGKKEVINKLIKRIFNKTGASVDVSKYIIGVVDKGTIIGDVAFPSTSKIDSGKINSDIAKKISERQKAIRVLYSTIKNAYELNSLDENGIKILLNSFSKSGIPQSFENLIEDEDYDDYGPDSGKRYIIKNSQIISYSINEKTPEFTAINVTGRMDKYLNLNATNAEGFEKLPNDGNPLVSSAAVDYDLWRMYGMKYGPTINKPFLTDPDSQTAPFAVALLNRERKKIIGGSVTVIGNEYYQPGDVVFLEQKNMLFYVQSVSHNMNIGERFTTTLTLAYGHYPGEYIPNTLDVAGKVLYNNKDTMSVQNNKKDIINGISIGCFVLPPDLVLQKDAEINIMERMYDFGDEYVNSYNTTIDSFNKKFLSSKTGSGISNLEVLKNIAKNFKAIIDSNTDKDNFEYKLKLVTYNDNGLKNKTNSFRGFVADILSGFNTLEDLNIPTFNSDSILILETDLSDKKNERRSSPSIKAINAATKLYETTSSANKIASINVGQAQTISKKKEYLSGYIVDCFIKKVAKV